MDEASIINFDDDISAFNGIVAVTTRDDLLPFHRVRAREDAEEGPPSARRAQARWIILSPCFATLSSRLICFEHTGQISFSYAMEPRYRLMTTGRRRRRVYVLLPSSENTTARHSGAWWGDCVSRARLSTLSHRGQRGGRRRSLERRGSHPPHAVPGEASRRNRQQLQADAGSRGAQRADLGAALDRSAIERRAGASAPVRLIPRMFVTARLIPAVVRLHRVARRGPLTRPVGA